MTVGEVIICGLIIFIVFIWSLSHIIFAATDLVVFLCVSIHENETVQNFCSVLMTRIRNTIGRKVRIIIRDFLREMRGKKTL